MTGEAFVYFISVFPDYDSAAACLQTLTEAQGEQKHIKDAALVRKNEDGKIHVAETVDKSGEIGARIGGFIGGLLGMFSGSAGVVIGVTTGDMYFGALGEKIHDAGVDNTVLKEFGATLEPGNAMLIAIVDQEWHSEANQILTTSGGRSITDKLDAHLIAELDEALEKYLGESVAGGDQ